MNYSSNKTNSRKRKYLYFFSKEYWILQVTTRKKSKERPIDIGMLISCEITTHAQRNIHSISSIKILSSYKSDSSTYAQQIYLLELLGDINKKIPPGIPNIQIYHMLSYLFLGELWQQESLLLCRLKLRQLLGELSIEDENISCLKVLKFIHSHEYREIFKLKHIPKEIQKKLEQKL